MTFERN